MSINRTILTGRLCGDPIISYTKNGKALGKCSLAVDDNFNKEKTNFLDLIFWGKTAELAGEYLRKGSKVGIIGSLQQQRWEKDGKKFSKVIINVDQLEFLDNKKKEETTDEKSNIDDSDFPWGD